MPFKGSLKVRDDVEVEFRAHPANSGTTLVNTGYVPQASAPSAPVVPALIVIAPGASAVQRTTVGPALLLIVDVDVPTGGGGQLDVRVNGAVRDSAAISSDVNWSYLIV